MAGIKCRNMMYEQQLAYLPYPDVDKLYKAIEDKVDPQRFALAVHDKDTDDKGNPVTSHVHVMMEFDNPRSIKRIAGLIGDKEQQIAKWNNNSDNGFAYLVHRTANAKHKYQYSPADVKANFNYADELEIIQKKADKKECAGGINHLLNDMYDGKKTKADVEKLITGAVYGKHKRKLDDVEAKRLQKEAESFRKNMIDNGLTTRVIWIYGETGTGKTSLALKIVKQENRPYYLGGSTKDCFQAYNGEHTIIMDEFRFGVMAYSDLLKMTDPHAESVMIPARYHDKYLAADLIIFTSPFSPKDYYDECLIKGRKQNTLNPYIDKFEQLERRIALTLYVDQASIYLSKFDPDTNMYQIVPSVSVPNEFSSSARQTSTTANAVEIFHNTLG